MPICSAKWQRCASARYPCPPLPPARAPAGLSAALHDVYERHGHILAVRQAVRRLASIGLAIVGLAEQGHPVGHQGGREGPRGREEKRGCARLGAWPRKFTGEAEGWGGVDGEVQAPTVHPRSRAASPQSRPVAGRASAGTPAGRCSLLEGGSHVLHPSAGGRPAPPGGAVRSRIWLACCLERSGQGGAPATVVVAGPTQLPPGCVCVCGGCARWWSVLQWRWYGHLAAGCGWWWW